MKNGRLYEIDLFRFIAAVMVVIYHYAFRGFASDHMTVMPYHFMSSFAKYGYLGVDLFFIISGFVILMTASKGSARHFFISRCVRLYPAFWTCCTITFLVTILIGAPRYASTFRQYSVNMTMLSGFLDVKPKLAAWVHAPFIDGVYWTLFVEMKFYFLIFLILCLKMIGKADVLLGAWLAVSLALSKWDVPRISFFLIPDYAPLFISGAFFYIIFISGLNFFRGFILSVSYATSVVEVIFVTGRKAVHYGISFNPLVITIVLTVFFLLFALISAKMSGWLSTPRWLLLGAITYPLYLLHQNIGYMLFNMEYPYENANIVMLTTVLLVLFISYSVNRFIEQRYAYKLKPALMRLFRLLPSPVPSQ